MNFPVFHPQNASPAVFAGYWAEQYSYKKEHLYSENIEKPLTPDRILLLFEWKNGTPLSHPKSRSVQNNYIARLAELQNLLLSTSPDDFLRRFSSGGGIWRIFWLHCWQPTAFPIYDQHVHRAMKFLQHQHITEIPADEDALIDSYLRSYIPFHRAHFGKVHYVVADRALWCFGKFVKAYHRLLAYS